jgi:dienelactone hydrolase
MRPLEIALTIFLLASACSLLWKRLLSPWLWLAADGCLLVAHLTFEGAHWQMIPAYAALLFFAAGVMLRARGVRIFIACAVLLLCVASSVLSAILPMFRLPTPTGPYAVGTRIMQLGTGNRAGRDVVFQVWYPAAPSHRPLAPYRRRTETTLQSSYQSVLPTNSRLEAPVAAGDGPFPVLLFSPAWGGRRTQNTYLTEELASHGYVVAGIDHPGNSGPTVFPDGHVDQPATGDAMDFTKLSLDEINAEGERELKRQTADELAVLDDLEQMNRDPASPFYQRLDMGRVGAFGHSFGGAVAAEAALEDSRVNAALDLDGSLFGRMQREGLPKPFMFFVEAPLPSKDPATWTAVDRIGDALDKSDFAAISKFGSYRVLLHGASHESFTDHSLFSPLVSLSGAGTIPKYRQFMIMRAYVLAFFDKTLRGEDPPLMKDIPGPFPEAKLEFIPKK